jgi:AraC-like DNA-binding protein
LAAYAPSADVLKEHEKKGKNLHAFLKGFGEEEKRNGLSLSFQHLRNLRLYYCPDCVMPLKNLHSILRPLTVRDGMSFVYAYPRAEALELLAERLEQSLNCRFLRPALIECSKKTSGFSTDTGMLDYAIEKGQQDSCRIAIGILLAQISAGAETIGELSSFYRHIILLFINKYVANNISMPGPLKLELSLFALCRYPNLKTLEAFLSGTASSLARIIGAAGRSRELIPGVIEYLKRNYRNNITLSDLSGHFYVSPSYLSRRFREKTGLTLVEYLEEIRLEKAEEYLASSEAKITDISEQVGYMDPNYFSKIFKRKYHLSPSDYRAARRLNYKGCSGPAAKPASIRDTRESSPPQ